MKAYIDRDNMLSLLSSRSDPRYRKCVELLSSHLDVQFNFTKEEMLEDDLLSDWFLELDNAIEQSNQRWIQSSKDIIPPRELKSNFYKKDKSYCTSVFLLDDSSVCDSISKKKCIVIGKPGEELQTLFPLVKSSNYMPTFSKANIPTWKAYIPAIPLLEAIICDDHFFLHKSVLDINKYDLLSAIVSHIRESSITITFITREGNIDHVINLEEERLAMTHYVAKITGISQKNINICIVTTNRAHDRHVITNYYMLNHGACFHLKDNGLKEDVYAEILPKSYKESERLANSLTRIYQDIANSAVHKFGTFLSSL